MGVNIVAIFPIKGLHEKAKDVILGVENNEYYELDAYRKATIEEGFAVPPVETIQWFEGDNEKDEQPQLLNINSALESKHGLVFRFREDAFEIWSYLRLCLAVNGNPQSRQALIDIYNVIGRAFEAEECWIMGDDNPIYHAFRKGEDFVDKAKYEKEESSIEYLCIDLGENYELGGFVKLNIQ